MAVGKLRRMVVDVNDLATGEAFWSAVTGLEVEFSGATSSVQSQFSGLGKKEHGSVLLQLVPERKTGLKNRAHIDLTVDDVSRAVEEVIGLGGSVVRKPGFFPEVDPELEWAVVADPFGNEFCVIRDIVH
ncbi:MAG: VOC family protein [Thermomicrobiales bacterium]